MLRLIIIFVLGMLTIPLIQNEPFLSAQGTSAPTDQTDILTITANSIQEASTAGLMSETQQPIPTTTATITTTTTQQPFKPLFKCDFSTPCFGSGLLQLTDGSEFNPPDLGVTTEPPRAPTSDVTSISTPTNNTQVCKLPYRPTLSDGISSVNWDMWFCYNNQCPTPNGQTGACASGSYGLISLDPSEPYKTIIDSLNPNTLLRDSIGDQCLRFYYYFTVYDQQNWGQEIGVWIRPNNQTDNQFFIDTITFNDMQNNSWNFRDITFNSNFSAYTLFLVFNRSIDNTTEDSLNNRTIYFALDNIELYDYNCSYVRDQLNPFMTTPSEQPTTVTTTATASTTAGANPPTTTPKSDLPLILGLSLGIGIPVLLGILGGLIYYFKVVKPKRKVIPNKDTTTDSTIGAVTDIPLLPTHTTNVNSTVATATGNPLVPTNATNDNSTVVA